MIKLIDLMLGLLFWYLLGLCAYETWHGNWSHAGGAFLAALFLLFLVRVSSYRR